MSTADLPPLAPGQRLWRMSLAWACLFGAGPGFLTDDGSLALACAGLALWGATVLRPSTGKKRWSFLAEFVPNAIGAGGWMAWVWYVFPGSFAYVAFGSGVYWTTASVLVRRLARRLPVAVAVATGVLGVEGVKALLPTPFGLGWLQLGHMAHHHLWLSTSARVWGLEGLSFVVTALGGLGAALLLGAHKHAAGGPRLRLGELAFGLTPLTLAALLSALAPERAEREGPLVLFVQPGFTQERKQFDSPAENFRTELELTRAAVEELVRAGTPPDLVAWAESMLYVPLFEPRVAQALESGHGPPPWSRALTLDDLAELAELEESWVRGPVLGEGVHTREPAALPDGTSFLAGAEVFTTLGEGEQRSVRRRVGVVLYDHPADGTPGGRAAVFKRNLVPGAETMLGLERLESVRNTIRAIAAYVPDFVAGEEPGVLTLTTREDEAWRFGVGVCFDNAFLGNFVDAFALADPSGSAPPPVDFHLIASNEAWYLTSFELDQMVAFSRIAALATERAVARATNSGISIVIGADGVERARIRDETGSDRAASGTLALRIPVPLAAARADRSPYVKTRQLWLVLGVAAPFLALALDLLGTRRRSSRGAR